MRLRFNKIALLSIAFSFLCHALFFTYSGRVWLKGVADELRGNKQLFDVKLVEETEPPVRSIISRPTQQDAKLRFERPFAELPTNTGVEKIVDKVEKSMEDNIQSDARLQESQMQLPDIRTIDYSKGTALEEKRRQVEKNMVQEPRMLLAKDNNLPQPEYEEIVPKEFEEQMPGFTPVIFIPQPGDRGLTKISYKSQGDNYSDFEEYLIADLVTYTDNSDGMKYFKITLMAGKDADKLKVIPKEIVFLIDCSLSTQEERMANFKKGLLYCLNNLNKEDIFNIISFKDKIQRLSAISLQPDDRAIKASSDFINSLEPSESTDVYRAFQEIIKAAPEKRPSYIILLSDGKPSVGMIDSREIISNINRINRETRSIFCYSAGTRVNRYLLDFIAYRNRGWSEYSNRSYDIAKDLQTFYDKIKDPILLNLRYRFSQLASDEAYPKSLPDFYKGAAFTIFGTYGDEDEFSMQLLGEGGENSMEFIFSDRLKEAPVGEKEIARQWAFNKIYYLIGKLSEEENDQEVISQINNLCEKFGIKTPYTYNVR